jgi:ABC-2 type transport system ATP-binding protein
MRVELDDVTKRYGSVRALDGVSLDLGPGITGLLGPNGAGKTTLIRILATLLSPSHGRVRLDGLDPGDSRQRLEIRRRLGYLPQDLGLYPRFTTFEFVDYIAVLKELKDRGERHRRVRAALTSVGLEDLATRKIRTLSGGMARRVGIAQALVADPGLLLLDEPTAGLDPEQRARFRELVAGLGDRRQVLLSTHLVEDVAAICTTVVVLWEGRVLFSGAPGELRSRASGMVWNTPEPVTGAVVCWRTESGHYRSIGDRPSIEATSVAPTVEDGYLLITSGAREDMAA